MFREVNTNTSSTLNSPEKSDLDSRRVLKLQSKDIRKSIEGYN